MRFFCKGTLIYSIRSIASARRSHLQFLRQVRLATSRLELYGLKSGTFLPIQFESTCSKSNDKFKPGLNRILTTLRSRRFRGEDLEREKFGTGKLKTGEA